MEEAVLRVKNLKTYFYVDDGVIPGVDDVSFDLKKGETLAIVGESGCGKSVTALSILRIIQAPPGRIINGEILFNGKDLLKLSNHAMRNVRGNDISMIFQEPMTSLNPVFTVGYQICQPLKFHQHLKKDAARVQAIEMIKLVGISSPERVVDQYPHQLSGGMRQRIMIAMALACRPHVLIADEPTTALDVTIQAQILRLIMDMKEELNTSVIFITHDLGVVAETSDNVMVMYAGQAVEYATCDQIFRKPLHPYTMGLLESIPKLHEDVKRLYMIRGMVPHASEFSKGCRFADRCDNCMQRCIDDAPELYDVGDGRHVRCFIFEKGEKSKMA
ncbi:MAG: peptide ABC transporter ATP-binding protein [Chloroflexi bacterium RBG_19FT_COMBO_47_9]|nr:MAG: peptide ABC transporter ATP-binding protein [Chloroflexi bacterium RBG_16_47_49]OGO59986.1 MAG: peptide ABC transporter ATP-binding protein [Chloroflexi bacterium RBG_19FT_COMBO_47_9]